MEPDIRSKVSSPITTTYALQYIEQLHLDNTPSLVTEALNYFDQTFKPETLQWYTLSTEINEAPRAPWWNFDEATAKTDENWGNPTVEIIGYIAKYRGLDKPEYQQVLEKAVERLKTRSEIETHELQCYFRLFKLSPKELQERLREDLFKHLTATVEVDPTKWEGYVTTPLTFVDSPESPAYELFSDAVEAELDRLIDAQGIEGGWGPTWEWGMYPEEWEVAKRELSGLITVRNLILLDKFKRLEGSEKN